ncbi:MAG: thioredoxin family protein [Ignisphaera sp.]
MDEYPVPPYINEMFKLDLTKEDIEAIRLALKDMIRKVQVLLFIGKNKLECFSCEDTERLVKIIANNSPLIGDEPAIELTVYDITKTWDLAKKYGITRVPTIVLLDGAIKYLGMPAGEEFKGFIETLIRVSNDEHGLTSETVKEIASLEGRAVIEVIVTPPCPYCPYAALLANMFAYVSKTYGRGNIESRIVEAYENPDIANRYAVTTVPTIAINNRVVFVGLPYEVQLLRAIKKLARNL